MQWLRKAPFQIFCIFIVAWRSRCPATQILWGQISTNVVINNSATIKNNEQLTHTIGSSRVRLVATVAVTAIAAAQVFTNPIGANIRVQSTLINICISTTTEDNQTQTGTTSLILWEVWATPDSLDVEAVIQSQGTAQVQREGWKKWLFSFVWH